MPPQVESPEDVTTTFVGAETYTDKSRPMGLADLMGLQLSDDTPPEAPAHPSPLVAPSQARATLVGVDKYKPESRPMGLFGLLSAEGAVSAVVVGRRLQLMRGCR